MDLLSQRMPLWLHLTLEEFEPLRARLPPAGELVHFYERPRVGRPDGSSELEKMVEVRVDLDDSFDAKRAALPLG
eukprot:5179265-Prymnesium_polylepis.1